MCVRDREREREREREARERERGERERERVCVLPLIKILQFHAMYILNVLCFFSCISRYFIFLQFSLL